MAPHIINALVSTFPGLPNLTLPLPSSTSISTLHSTLQLLLPLTPRLLLSTTSGRILAASSSTPISVLAGQHDFLTLRVALPLPGGKGGFGSQLRAAGGRMSSRKKRGQQENNDSCRNLDGRRMRTVKEAKALAAFLEIKPEMERLERARRRARAEKAVADADKAPAASKRRFEDVAWLDEAEEEKERLRRAVGVSMEMGFTDRTFTGGSGGSSSGSGSDQGAVGMRFAGWDEDDEFMSDDDGDSEEEEEMADIEEEHSEDSEEDSEEEKHIKQETHHAMAMADVQQEKDKGKGKGKGKANECLI